MCACPHLQLLVDVDAGGGKEHGYGATVDKVGVNGLAI